MCNLVYFSTTSEEDLAQLSSSVIRMRAPDDSDDESLLDLLAHPSRWYLESRYGGCSCHYRHRMYGDPSEFGPLEEWSNEDADDIESTLAAYDLFQRLVAEGDAVDVLDVWNDTPPEDVRELFVSLSDVPRESFRFFEGYRFVFSA